LRKAYRELRRRPLLTPLWLMALWGILAVAVVGWFYSELTTTTVVLVPPAEKALGTIDDAPLSEVGAAQAESLARLFGERGGVGRLAAVFTADTRLARNTAAPLALRLGVRAQPVQTNEPADLWRRIRGEFRGRNVLVVTDGELLAQLAQRLTDAQVPPQRTANKGRAFYVITVPTLGRASLLAMTY
jgi:broad specificity phosphatase PhoE